MSTRTIRQYQLCTALFAFITLYVLFTTNHHLGFMWYVLTFVIGSICTGTGVVAGEAFRRFVHPDVLLASNSLDMFGKRIFWLCGPQVIGWVIGLWIYQTVMMKFGYYY